MIPGNDDAIRAIQLYCARLADACLEGARIHNDAPPERGGRGGAGAAGEGRDGRAVHGPRGGRDHAAAAARARGGAAYGGDRREARGAGAGGDREDHPVGEA